MHRILSLTALLVLLIASGAAANTVYYAIPGQHGVHSVTGTITETDGVLTVTREDGTTVEIPRSDVYQVVTDKKSAQTTEPKAPSTETGEASPMDIGASDMLASMPLAARASKMSHAGPEPVRKKPYQLGLVGGLTVSNMSVEPVELQEENSLAAFAVGGWWRRPVTSRWSLQAEALYSVKGDSETTGGFTTSTKISYLDVPVLAKYGFRRGSAWQPSVFAGPAIGLNLTASSRIEGAGTNVDTDVKDQVKTVDVGLVLGGGVNFELGGYPMGLDLRFSKGLSNAVNEQANGTARNDVLALMGSIALQ